MEDSILRFQYNPKQLHQVRLTQQVHYSKDKDDDRVMSLLLPWSPQDCAPRPLIVFVQGSSWTTPDLDYEIPQLSLLAKAGYTVATVSHRSALKGFPSPTFLKDVKQAIRFLRANAATYAIDVNRVAVFGTSSGGNTALLAGLTGDDPAFRTDEYAEQSDAVSAVVECFGPSNLFTLLNENLIERLETGHDPDGHKSAPIFFGLVGNRPAREVLAEMSPVLYVEGCKSIPPMYLLQGDADLVVPYEQTVEMYEKLRSVGACVQMARVEGAPHERSFWSDAVFDSIHRFLDKHLNWKTEDC